MHPPLLHSLHTAFYTLPAVSCATRDERVVLTRGGRVERSASRLPFHTPHSHHHPIPFPHYLSHAKLLRLLCC